MWETCLTIADLWTQVLASPLLGQATEDAANPVVTTNSKSYVLDGIIVVALIGVALVAVCKSSMRR